MVGRVSRDAVLKTGSSGTSFCDFGIAVNRSRKKESGEWEDVPHFFNLMLFGTRAGKMNEYLVKGQTVSVEGHLEMMSYERDGYKNTRMVLNIDDIRLIGPHKKAGKPGEGKPEEGSGTHSEDADISSDSDEIFPEYPALTDEDLNLEGLEGEADL
jgi:single-strand DNA-binding protein